MRRTNIVAMSLVLGLCGNANATLFKLLRQFIRNTPGGEPELVCVYGTEGHELERTYPARNWCPEYLEPEATT